MCSGLATIGVLAYDFMADKVADVTAGPTVWTISFAVLMAASSFMAVVWSRCSRRTSTNVKKDPHFRRAVLLKGCLLNY